MTFSVDAKGEVDGMILKVGSCMEQTAKKVNRQGEPEFCS